MTPTLAPAVAPVAPEIRPAETVTPLRPSEALRLGRLLRPRRITIDIFEGTTGACALGSMLAGAGVMAGDPSLLDVEKYFPEMAGVYDVACPVGDESCDDHSADDLIDIVYSLNDVHEWSDAQIVAFLESHNL